MGPHGQFVLLFARDAVLATQILRGLDHPAGDRMRRTTRCFTGAVESIHQRDAALTYAGAKAERVVLDVRHRLGPAGDDDAGRTGGDLTRGVQHRLQAGTAAAVDLKSGDAGAQPRIEGRDPADRGRFAAGVAVAEDHVVHVAFDRVRSG